MFIHDLEFVESCDLGIRGGAAAFATASTSTTDDAVFAGAVAVAEGDFTQANAVTGTAFFNRSNYTAGYGISYGAAFGANNSGSAVATYDLSLTVV